MKIHRLHTLLLSLFLGVLVLPCLALADGTGGLATTPEHILMGAQYDGLNLKVNGTVPAGSDVILRFTGAAEELHLREKGKVFGLLWMNVGKVSLKNVPKACLIDSSRPLDELGTVAVPFRLEGLRDAIEIGEEAGTGTVDIAHELLLLKKDQGLYNETAKGVTLGADQGPSRTFSAELPIPSALAPGDYQVEAVAIKDGAVVGRYATAVKAELTGFPRWLSKLAFERSLLYGVLATLIAIFSGLAIGLVFQSKGAH
ncbi:MAG: TIGR02186 family protein [Desulfoprunum sp.]|nr:TIGR02186 family protein [Desulfoprunum sp.]